MTSNIWLAAGALAVTVVTLITTLLSADRSKTQLEALEKAIAIRHSSGLPDETGAELDKFIKFTGLRLGSVWWRNPFFPIGVLCLGLAAATWVPWAMLDKRSRDEMGIAGTVWLCAAFVVAALTIFVGSWAKSANDDLT